MFAPCALAKVAFRFFIKILEKGKIALLPFSHYSAWALQGKRVKPHDLNRAPKKYRRTFWEEEEPPSTPCLLPKAKGWQAKASDDEGVPLKICRKEGSALKIVEICFNSLKQISRVRFNSVRRKDIHILLQGCHAAAEGVDGAAEHIRHPLRRRRVHLV